MFERGKTPYREQDESLTKLDALLAVHKRRRGRLHCEVHCDTIELLSCSVES